MYSQRHCLVVRGGGLVVVGREVGEEDHQVVGGAVLGRHDGQRPGLVEPRDGEHLITCGRQQLEAAVDR